MATCGATRLGQRARSTTLLLWLLCAGSLCLLVPGCGGCWTTDPVQAQKDKEKKEEEERRKKLEKPKEDFEATNLVLDPGLGGQQGNYAKPGHWVTASQTFKANNSDLPRAELYSAAVDRAGRLLEVDDTPYRLIMSRDISLPKGSAKPLESLFYIPRKFDTQSETVYLQSKIFALGGAREIFTAGINESTIRMKDYEFHLVVLASDPDRYGYLKRLESIRPVNSGFEEDKLEQSYRVQLPKFDKHPPLPSHPLAWTSMAYLFWDGIDPARLTPEQQKGLIDWLHWGGQLIISGPDSLDTLRAGYLAKYLPAEKTAARELDQAAFAELNDFWSRTDKKLQLRKLEVVEGKLPVGVALKLQPPGVFLPHCSELVAERRVGRGRVVVTGFSLTSRAIVNWASFDNFFNAVLLRRPNRVYFLERETEAVDVRWQDERFKESKNDPRLSSALRYFSRDIGTLGTGEPSAVAPKPIQPNKALSGITPAEEEVAAADKPTPPPASVNDWRFDGFGTDPQAGVAGWSDFSAAADASRISLREAAGISIPKAGFVLRVVAVYLLVLVPLNWGLFWLIGRVEWAWVAAPLIAIVGAVMVIRLAQLDIGFARSHTELAILEAHAGHERGHLTRYAALYSSLSTGFDVEFDDTTALAQPFPLQKREEQSEFNRPPPTNCYFRRADRGLTLSGVIVRSNSTNFVHSEQMLSLGGAFALNTNSDSAWSLDNQSQFPLEDAAVLRCTSLGEYEVAYVGQLKAKTSVFLTFVPAATPFASRWKESAMLSKERAAPNELSLWRLAQLATEQLHLDPGDVRLIGWTGEELPGMAISPRAAQVTTRTLALVHLREAPLPAIRSDDNLRISVVDENAKPPEDTEPPPPPPDGN